MSQSSSGSLLKVLVLVLWYWRTNACCNDSDEDLTVWNITIVNRLELNWFIENVTTYTHLKNSTNCLYISLAGGNIYELDIVKLMKIAINGSLVMESKGGLAEINCTTGSHLSDLEELSQTVQPLSRASQVLLDGLILVRCPVPILIEEASNVVLQNCAFQ